MKTIIKVYDSVQDLADAADRAYQQGKRCDTVENCAGRLYGVHAP